MQRICTRQKIWLGYQYSNLGMLESKSSALPLGDTPLLEASNQARFDQTQFNKTDDHSIRILFKLFMVWMA